MKEEKYDDLEKINNISGISLLIIFCFILGILNKLKNIPEGSDMSGLIYIIFLIPLFLFLAVAVAIYINSFLKIDKIRKIKQIESKNSNFDILKIIRAMVLGIAIFLTLFLVWIIIGNIIK